MTDGYILALSGGRVVEVPIPEGPEGPAGPVGSLSTSHRGEWSPSATYATGDIVTYDDSSWYATDPAPSTGIRPGRPDEPVVEVLDFEGVSDGAAFVAPPGWRYGRYLGSGTPTGIYSAGRLRMGGDYPALEVQHPDPTGAFVLETSLQFQQYVALELLFWDRAVKVSAAGGGVTVNGTRVFDFAGMDQNPGLVDVRAEFDGVATLLVEIWRNSAIHARRAVNVGAVDKTRAWHGVGLNRSNSSSYYIYVREISFSSTAPEEPRWQSLARAKRFSFYDAFKGAWQQSSNYEPGDLVVGTEGLFLARNPTLGEPPAPDVVLQSIDFVRDNNTVPSYPFWITGEYSNAVIGRPLIIDQALVIPGTTTPNDACHFMRQTPEAPGPFRFAFDIMPGHDPAATVWMLSEDPNVFNPSYQRWEPANGRWLRHVGSTNVAYNFTGGPVALQAGDRVEFEYNGDTSITSRVTRDSVVIHLNVHPLPSKYGGRHGFVQEGPEVRIGHLEWEDGTGSIEAPWELILPAATGPQGPAGEQGPAGPSGPAGSGFARTTLSRTTGSLAPGDTQQITAAGVAPAARLLSVQTDVPARVRVYAAATDMAADATRAIGTDPTGDHGLMLEYVTADGALSGRLSPLVDWWNSDGGTDLYLAVTNLDDAAAAVTTTITYLRTE